MTTPRTWFAVAADGFVEVAEAVSEEQLDLPGLGDWDVRSLLGHATRAFLTLETYLAAEPAAVTLNSAAAYFIATRAGLADPAAVTQRGRDAGAALGDDPVRATGEIARRVRGLLEQTSDQRIVTTPVGGILLADYLPTRAFELTVHGIDLARAVSQPVPGTLADAAVEALELAARIADRQQRVDLLLAATGRINLPEGFSLV